MMYILIESLFFVKQEIVLKLSFILLNYQTTHVEIKKSFIILLPIILKLIEYVVTVKCVNNTRLWNIRNLCKP